MWIVLFVWVLVGFGAGLGVFVEGGGGGFFEMGPGFVGLLSCVLWGVLGFGRGWCCCGNVGLWDVGLLVIGVGLRVKKRRGY